MFNKIQRKSNMETETPLSDALKPIIEACRLVEIPRFSDIRGDLSVLDTPELPFKVERVFWLHHVPQDVERGHHAHRSCFELLIPVAGTFEVELSVGRWTKVFNLSEHRQGLIIPPMAWCRLRHFSPSCVALCLASESYSPEGYIYDFEQYLQACECLDRFTYIL